MSDYIDKFRFYDDSGNLKQTIKMKKSFLVDKKVLFMGDSLTAGRVAKPEGGYETSSNPYPNVFCDILGIDNFYNSAVPGATANTEDTPNWFNQYSEVPQIASYDIIFFMFGTNDYLNNATIGNRYDYSLGKHSFIKDSYRTLNTLCTQCKGSQIICLLPPYIQRSTNSFGLTLEKYRNAMAWVAQQFNIPVIDMSLIGFNSNNASYLMSDSTHFNDISYKMMGEYLAQAFLNNYYLSTCKFNSLEFPTAHNTVDSTFFDVSTITDQPLYAGYYIDVNGTVTSKKAVFTSKAIPLMLRFNVVNSSNIRSMKVTIKDQVFNVLLNPLEDFVTIAFTGSGGSGNITFETTGTVRISNIYYGVYTPFPVV